jgi:hypothetical protein
MYAVFPDCIVNIAKSEGLGIDGKTIKFYFGSDRDHIVTFPTKQAAINAFQDIQEFVANARGDGSKFNIDLR